MYYPSSENKGADQLRGYREADLRLCFRPCKLLVFSRTGSNHNENNAVKTYAMFVFSGVNGTTTEPREPGEVLIEDITNTTEDHNDLEESHQDSAIEPPQVQQINEVYEMNDLICKPGIAGSVEGFSSGLDETLNEISI